MGTVKRKAAPRHQTDRVVVPLEVKTAILAIGSRNAAMRELRIASFVYDDAVAVGGRVRREVLERIERALVDRAAKDLVARKCDETS